MFCWYRNFLLASFDVLDNEFLVDKYSEVGGVMGLGSPVASVGLYKFLLP